MARRKDEDEAESTQKDEEETLAEQKEITEEEPAEQEEDFFGQEEPQAFTGGSQQFSDFDIIGSSQRVAPVLETQSIENLESSAEAMPSSHAVQTQGTSENRAAQDALYSPAGRSASNSNYKEFSQYEADTTKRNAEDESHRRISGRDLFFDTASLKEGFAAAAPAWTERSAGRGRMQESGWGGAETDDFQTEQRKYQEKLEQETGPAFRRRKTRGNLMR